MIRLLIAIFIFWLLMTSGFTGMALIHFIVDFVMSHVHLRAS